MNYTLESVPCNICESDSHHIISAKGKGGLPTNVVLCKNCGLGYLNPRWDADSYMSFYRNEYDHYYRPKILKVDTYKKSDINPIEDRLKRFGHFPDSANTILDIGSGEGKNLKHFARLFPKSSLLAIEPSIESQKQLSEFGVTTISDNVDNDWELKHLDQVDIIIMRHVLEHFMDPLSALKKIRKALSNEGVIYIAVPNNLKPNKHLEGNWFRNVHTYYFNKYSLKNLLRLAGFEIMNITEGDQHNRHEVFLIARKSENIIEPSFSTEDYSEQLEVFTNQLKSDNRISQRILRILKQIRKAIR